MAGDSICLALFGQLLGGVTKKMLKSSFKTRRWSMIWASSTTPAVTLEQLQRLSLWSNGEIDKVSKEGVLITDNFPFTEFPLWRYLRGDRSRWQPEQVREYFGIVQEDRGPSANH